MLSAEGDKWSVRFDVRDLGGHSDTTFRGWSSTLAARVRLVISPLVLIFALPLDFHGGVRESPRLSFEHDVHCCFVLALVSVSCCKRGISHSYMLTILSASLGILICPVISRLVLIVALPLDFHGRIRVVRSMYLPAALH